MMKKLCVCSALLATACLMSGSPTLGAIIIDPPSGGTTGASFPGFPPSNLFDGSVSAADVGSTSYGAGDSQFAGNGVGPHVVFMDYGSSVTAIGVAYAQRAGNDPLADKVGLIEFWFSNDDFGGVIPASSPDVSTTITNTTNQVLTEYDFGGSASGRYVAARFTAASLDPPTNNPGGSEMRLLGVPEPATNVLFLLASASAGFAALRRSRRCLPIRTS